MCHWSTIEIDTREKNFTFDTLSVYTWRISLELRQTSFGDSKWKLFTSFLYSEVHKTPHTIF